MVYLIVVLLCLIGVINSDTFYVCVERGSDGNSGTSSEPWLTFEHAFSQISGGDTIVVKKGIYQEGIGNFVWENNQQLPINNPPSGSQGNPTTVRSEIDGHAIIDMKGTGNPLWIGNNYINIEGFKFLNGQNSVGAVSGSFVNVRRCAFGNAGTGDVSIISAEGNNILFEDCWVWGRGRAGLTTSGNSIIIRRFVARMDYFDHNHEHTGVLLYGAKDVIVENAISLDFNPSPIAPAAATMRTGFRSRYGYDAVDHRFLGCISLNLPSNDATSYYGFSLGAAEGPLNGGKVENCIAYNVSRSGFQQANWNSVFETNKLTVGNPYNGVGFDFDTFTLKNSLSINSNTNNIPGSGSHNFFDNSEEGGSNAVSGNSGLLYLPRIDSNELIGSGENGENRGAEIIYKYENGVLTNKALWPWPFESRIKEDMAEDFGLPNNNPQRGFMLKDSLTSYIWEYLGNPCPEEICINQIDENNSFMKSHKKLFFSSLCMIFMLSLYE